MSLPFPVIGNRRSKLSSLLSKHDDTLVGLCAETDLPYLLSKVLSREICIVRLNLNMEIGFAQNRFPQVNRPFP